MMNTKEKGHSFEETNAPSDNRKPCALNRINNMRQEMMKSGVNMTEIMIKSQAMLLV